MEFIIEVSMGSMVTPSTKSYLIPKILTFWSIITNPKGDMVSDRIKHKRLPKTNACILYFIIYFINYILVSTLVVIFDILFPFYANPQMKLYSFL